jgi:aldehyde dehydrogenase (NAD+)
VFAPVAAVFPAGDLDEAVTLANEGPGNLAASVFTGGLASALEVVEHLDAGLIRVNAPTSGIDFHTPFGGSGGASLGPRELGHAALDFFGPKSTIGVWA